MVDKDDRTTVDYLGDYYDHSAAFVFGDPTGDPTGPLNREAIESKSDWVGFIGDDSRCRTPGWDALVEGPPGIVVPYDGTTDKGHPWPSTCFVHTKIVRALGYMVPPTLHRGFFDVFWMELGNRTKCIRVIDALFPHDNSRGDPSKPNFDPAFRVAPEVIAADERAYHEWYATQRHEDVRKVRHALYA